MPDLVSIVLTLRPLPTAAGLPKEAPYWWGRAVHALLLRTVRSYDPAAAEELHSDNGRRPFTTSTLFDRSHSPAGERACLRLTAFEGKLAGLLLDAAQGSGPLAPGKVVELDDRPFEIVRTASAPDEHPWAARAAYGELAARRLVSQAAPPRQLALQLASPTAFKSQDRHQPLPLPELVFGSLLERWNLFAPVAFPPDARRYAAECLAISRFDLHSRRVPGNGGGVRIGSVGTVTYTTLTYDRYWMSLLHTLAAFACYAGAGAGTTSGLGQCRAVTGAAEAALAAADPGQDA